MSIHNEDHFDELYAYILKALEANITFGRKLDIDNKMEVAIGAYYLGRHVQYKYNRQKLEREARLEREAIKAMRSRLN